MNSLDRMRSDYCRQPIPSYAEQIELGRLIQAWQQWPGPGPCPRAVERRGLRARDRLVAGNLRLVITEAGRWRRACRSDEEQMDLMQLGAMGLARAAEKYDPTTGYKFSTYAHWWIRQAMGRAAPNISALVYIPGSARERYTKLTKLIAEYESEHGFRPSVALLADMAGLTVAQVEESCVAGKMRLLASLDATVRSDADASALGDLLPSDAPELLDTLADEELTEQRAELAHQLLGTLQEEDRQIAIDHHFGGVELRDSAAQRGCSRSRIGQIRLRAVQRMRQNAEQAAPHWRELLIAA